MMIGETIRVAFASIRANKLRAGLTMLGIIIGVGAVIAVVALGTGAQRAIEERIKAMGANLLTVYPGQSFMGGRASDTRVSLTVDGAGVITAARVALGAVAARVLLVPEAAQAIIGSRLDKPAQDRLEAAAQAACRPIDDKRGTVEFRIQVAGVLARRAALIALDRARSN